MATLSAIKIGGWIGRGQSEITRELLDPFCTPWGPGGPWGALGGPGGALGGPWGVPGGSLGGALGGPPLFPPIPPLDSYAVGSTSGAVYTGKKYCKILWAFPVTLPVGRGRW